MNENIRFLREAVLNFVYKLEEVDTALVVSFNESVKGSAEFTGYIDRLERFVEGLQALGRHQPLRRDPLLARPHQGPAWPQGGHRTLLGRRRHHELDGRQGGRGLRPRGRGHGVQHRLQGLRVHGLQPARPRISRPRRGSSSRLTGAGELIKVFNEISNELKNHYLLARIAA